MKKYDVVVVDMDYVNIGLTGLNGNIHEWISGSLKYHDNMEVFKKGLIKFFKTCFRKSIYFRMEVKGQNDIDINRLFFFMFDYSNFNNKTVQVYTCSEDGAFDWNDKQIMSQDKFIKNFLAMLEDMQKRANVTE